MLNGQLGCAARGRRNLLLRQVSLRKGRSSRLSVMGELLRDEAASKMKLSVCMRPQNSLRNKPQTPQQGVGIIVDVNMP